jgi:acyl-CoA thioesterase-1
MRRWLAMLLLSAWASTATAGQEACPIPEALALADLKLPGLKTAFTQHVPLKIVALGASSTEGSAAGDPQWTYPARLQAHLAEALPGTEIIVTNKGIPHQTTAEMTARLERDVLAEHPALVIWDAGTVDAARSLDVAEFSEALSAGVDRLRAAGIDIIVMDMQYAPSTDTIIDFEPYIDALNAVAERSEIPVFSRFEVMHSWSESGLFAYDETAPAARTATARRVYNCLAGGLAESIAAVLK